MKVLVGIITGLLVAVFVAIGGMAILRILEALISGPLDPEWPLRLLIGLVEIAGGVILFVPSYSTLGAAGLATMMVGTVLRNLTQGHTSRLLTPLVLTFLLLVVGFARRPSWLWPGGGEDNPS